MKKITLLLIISLLLCSCASRSEEIDSAILTIENQKFNFPLQSNLLSYGYNHIVIMDNHDDSLYHYKIFTSNDIVCEGEIALRQPEITYHSGIVKLVLAYGSNDATTQYFDVIKGLRSEVFPNITGSAEYVSKVKGEYITAYFDYNDKMETTLVIQSMFGNDFLIHIERDFVSPVTAINYMTFLNQDEIYLDYNVMDDSNGRTQIKEIVKFR